MKIWLEAGIGEAVRQRSAQERKLAGPALSCEADHVAPDRAKELVLSAIRGLKEDVLIGFFSVGSGRRECVRACLLDMFEVARVIDAALVSEDVVTLRDPTVLGGCTFDFSPDEVQGEQATVELLVTAWGVHEEMVTRLAEVLGEETFRQGSSLRLEK